MLAEKPERSSSHAAPTSVRRTPVADVTSTEIVDLHSNRAHDTFTRSDGELVGPSRDISPDEGARVVLRIRARDDRNPMLNLRVVARRDDRRNVVQRPWTQFDVAVAQLHLLSLERRKAAVAALPRKHNRRLPTLPGGCPPSTIGASRLNFSVRNGKRCFPAAMTAEVVRALRVSAHPQNSIAPHSVFKIKTSSN